MTFLGHRYERHRQHMDAVRAVQRRNQLQRVEKVLAQHEAWRRVGVDLNGDAAIIETLYDMRAELLRSR